MKPRFPERVSIVQQTVYILIARIHLCLRCTGSGTVYTPRATVGLCAVKSRTVLLIARQRHSVHFNGRRSDTLDITSVVIIRSSLPSFGSNTFDDLFPRELILSPNISVLVLYTLSADDVRKPIGSYTRGSKRKAAW